MNIGIWFFCFIISCLYSSCPKKSFIEECQIFQKFDMEIPPVSEDLFEWIDLLESIDEAQNKFVMLEVGAGYGRWSGRAGRVSAAHKIPYYLVLIEGEPSRREIAIHKEMEKNGIPLSNYDLVKCCVGPVNGKAFFYTEKDGQTIENWFGQCIILNHDCIDQKLSEKYYGCPQFLTRYGYRAVEIEQKKLSEILSSVPSQIIDLCDFDIQGMEFEVIQESISVLNHRVKRLHIGTHSREIERCLRQLLTEHGWRLIRDYPLAQVNQTPYGDAYFVDGIQTWHNEQLMHDLESPMNLSQ